MTPVHLALLCWQGLEPDEGGFVFLPANSTQIVLENSDPSVVSERGDPLKDDRGWGPGIDLKKPVNLLLERIQFTAPLDLGPGRIGVLEELSDGLAVKMKDGGNFCLGPSFAIKTMDLEDRVSIDHGFLPGNG